MIQKSNIGRLFIRRLTGGSHSHLRARESGENKTVALHTYVFTVFYAPKEAL